MSPLEGYKKVLLIPPLKGYEKLIMYESCRQ